MNENKESVLAFQEYVPTDLSLENVIEKKNTFLATARSTDEVRQQISSGKFDALSSKDVYMAIHSTHVLHNPQGVYAQEHIPGIHESAQAQTLLSQSGDPEPGIYRTGECSVGFFFQNLPAKEVEHIGDQFFQKIDTLLAHADFLSRLDTDQKLLLLIMLDQMMVLGHFVKDASGRTGEDFLHFVASRMHLPFTISTSGFRGQMPIDDLEYQIEGAFWIFRNELEGQPNVLQASKYLLRVLQILCDAAQKYDYNEFDEVLLRHEDADISVDPLLAHFHAGIKRKYEYLPEDEKLQEQMAEIAAHWSLYEAEVYYPEESTAPTVKEYLHWHLQAIEKLCLQIQSAEGKTFVDFALTKVAVGRQAIIDAEEKFKQEEEEAKIMLAQMRKPAREWLDPRE